MERQLGEGRSDTYAVVDRSVCCCPSCVWDDCGADYGSPARFYQSPQGIRSVMISILRSGARGACL